MRKFYVFLITSVVFSFHYLVEGQEIPRQTLNQRLMSQSLYNRSCREHPGRYINFDGSASNDQPIGTSIPGLDFSYPSNPGNFLWTYKEPTWNSNVYPYNFKSRKPVYWFNGRAAWIGEETTDSLFITARIYFTHATASVICMGYTSCYQLNIRAYNISGELINPSICAPAQAMGQPCCPDDSYGSGQIKIIPDEEHLGEYIYYIEIDGVQNTFAIDNLIVYDFLYKSFDYVPYKYEAKLQKIDMVQPGGEPDIYNIAVDNTVDNLKTICYWDYETDPGILLDVHDPLGNLVITTQKPLFAPVIPNPMIGTWKINISSLAGEGKAYPYSIIGALGYKILVDCYIEPGDISFDPAQPDSGQNVRISAKVHAGNQYSKPMEDVLVRCYLGEPDSANKIGRDSYALNIPPDSAKTVSFYINYFVFQGINPCKIYIALDPNHQLEEYNENNNVAFKELTFAP